MGMFIPRHGVDYTVGTGLAGQLPTHGIPRPAVFIHLVGFDGSGVSMGISAAYAIGSLRHGKMRRGGAVQGPFPKGRL